MQIDEWLNGPEIKKVQLAFAVEGVGGDLAVHVGNEGVTRIERTSHGGMHCEIPYVRIWKGDVEAAQYCLHQIVGVSGND